MASLPKLALDGGRPVRSQPLPLEFAGAHFYDRKEADLVGRVVKARSPFRYYGFDLQHMTDRFETAFAKYIGVPHALGVNSGTSALTVSLVALGVGPGDEVIIPGYMWVSTIAAVVRLGAVPVLADIDESYCLDPVAAAAKITPQTKAIIMVHMNGGTGKVREIARLCRQRRIGFLEDVAQAAGGTVGGKKLGSFGDISIFSFQLNKTMTTGEGGAICTRDKHLFQRAFAAHDLGYARNAAGRLDFLNVEAATWGSGSRMSELTAALAVAQLAKLDRICGKMRASQQSLLRRLARIPGLGFRRMTDAAGDCGSFLLTRFPSADDAEFYVRALRAEGIVPAPGGISNFRITDWGLHVYFNIPALQLKLPVSGSHSPWTDPRNVAGQSITYAKGTLPRCDDLVARTIFLCIPPVLTRRMIDDVVAAYEKVAAHRPLVRPRVPRVRSRAATNAPTPVPA